MADTYDTAQKDADALLKKDWFREYLDACELNNAKAAWKLAQTKDITAPQMLKGVETLAVHYQNYEDIGPLLTKSGAVQNGQVTEKFKNEVLTSSRDPMAAVLFLNGLETKYDLKDFDQTLTRGEDVSIQMIRSGNFDATQQSSRALLHAAAMGQTSVFHALMDAGAKPEQAISGGSNDQRWDGVYSGVAKMAESYYKANPAKKPAAAVGVTLENKAYMKEVRLSPTARS